MQQHITIQHLIDFLSRVEGFQEIQEDLESLIIPLIGIAAYEPGQFVIERGTLGTDLFVLYKGRASIRVVKGDGEFLSFGMEIGSVVGEMSLVSDQPRTADIISDSQTTFLTLDIQTFHSLMNNHWRITKAFAGLIGRRMIAQRRRALETPQPSGEE